MREVGVRVSLGKHSAASNNVVDMFEEMREAVFMQRARDRKIQRTRRSLRLSYGDTAGAECLGLAQHLGSL